MIAAYRAPVFPAGNRTPLSGFPGLSPARPPPPLRSASTAGGARAARRLAPIGLGANAPVRPRLQLFPQLLRSFLAFARRAARRQTGARRSCQHRIGRIRAGRWAVRVLVDHDDRHVRRLRPQPSDEIAQAIGGDGRIGVHLSGQQNGRELATTEVLADAIDTAFAALEDVNPRERISERRLHPLEGVEIRIDRDQSHDGTAVRYGHRGPGRIGLRDLRLRSLESREDKRPRLGDLRESGAIEQDADVVLFIYRDEAYNPDKIESKGIAEVVVAKHRQGAVGKVQMTFLPEFTLFADMGRDVPIA